MGKLTCGKPLKEVNAEYIKRAVELFIKLSDGFETRSKTWNDCHKCFGDIHGSLKKSGYSRTLSPDEEEKARLYLMNYLASWGMYRGSSFVLQYDSNIYKDIIDIIFDKDYNVLWDLKYEDLKQNTSDVIIGKVCKIFNAIEKKLDEKRIFTMVEKVDWFNQYKKNKAKNNNTSNTKVSRTLVSKILLGTICCMPALDTNFNAIVGHTDKPLDETYLQFLFEMILKKGNSDDFDLKNNKNDYVFKELSKTYPEIPLMKIVDMAFFTIGDEKKFKKLFEKYVLYGQKPEKDKEWNEWVKLIKHFYYRINPNKKCTLNVAFLFNAEDYINNSKFIGICKELGYENPTKKDEKDTNKNVLDLDELMKKYIDKNKDNISSALERIIKKTKGRRERTGLRKNIFTTKATA